MNHDNAEGRFQAIGSAIGFASAGNGVVDT